MSENAKQNIGKLGTLWCNLMHDSPMWPIHGQYECRTCGRQYAVPWSERVTGTRVLAARVRPMGVPSAMLPLAVLLAILLAPLARAADPGIIGSTAEASMAFARYTAGLHEAGRWDSETVQIDASLPKLEKHGRLRAIRRLLPFGKPEYQVIDRAGDQTVQKQVILRYLSADARALAMPAALVAITPANYQFRYKRAVQAGRSVAYVFLITPRTKREGLLKGELWLDGETGAVVRQSGYLVKSPSIFVKRIDVTRETTLRDGTAQSRVTHVSLRTRLVGPAELTIEERPYTSPDDASPLGIVQQ